MSFIGSNYSGTSPNNFFTPEPSGVDASRWAKYPAIQEVDVGGFDIKNVNLITANDFEIATFDVNDLTVTNNLTVVNNTQTDTLLAETSMTSQSLYLGLTGVHNGRIRAVDGQVLFVESALGGGNEMLFGKNASSAGITHKWDSSGENGFTEYRASGGTIGTTISYNLMTTSGGLTVGSTSNLLGDVIAQSNITAQSNLTVEEDVYVSGTSYLHGVEALEDSTFYADVGIEGATTMTGALVFPNPTLDTNFFKTEYVSSGGLQKLNIDFYTGTPTLISNFITLQDDTLSVSQIVLHRDMVVEDDITQTGGSATFLDTTVDTLTADSVATSGNINQTGGTTTLLDTTVDTLTADSVVSSGNINQTGGTATLKDTVVDTLKSNDGKIKLPTPTYLDAEFGTEDARFNVNNPNSLVLSIKTGPTFFPEIMPIAKYPRTIVINGTNPALSYQQYFDTPANEMVQIHLTGSGILVLNIYENFLQSPLTGNLPMTKMINIRYAGSSWNTVTLNLLDSSDNPSTYKYNYVDMSSGTIQGRNIRQTQNFQIYAPIHNFQITSVGDGSDPEKVIYYVEYK